MGQTAVVREGVVAVIEQRGRYLTITRSEKVIAPGKICFPGGGIEPNETPQEALIRECLEELDVLIKPIRELDVSITPWGVRLHWFSAELVDEAAKFQPNPREVAAINWMTRDEMLAHPDTLESNIPFLQQLTNL